jgi:hypothetical protein
MLDQGSRGRRRTLRLTFGLAFLAVTPAIGCGGGGKPETGADAGTVGCTDPLMIDDMEDGDRFICNSGGRRGAWYTVDDGTSTNLTPPLGGNFTQTMIPGGRGTSRQAARLTGSGFTIWGAAMGFNLNQMGSTIVPYDASATQGVKFWMKSNVPVYVNFPIPATLSLAEPAGTCVDSAGEWNCDNLFGFPISVPTPGEWVEYDVPYAALTQETYRWDSEGNPIYGNATFDPTQLVNIQFNVRGDETFDVWIDDIRFYSCAGSDCVPTCTNPAYPVACPARGAVTGGCRPIGTDCSKVLDLGLLAVWGSGPADVWAVGYEGTLYSGASDQVGYGGAQHTGAIVHWDGISWSSVPGGTPYSLDDVWGSGPGDVWAVGNNGTLLHWDSSAWSPRASGTTYPLEAVWGTDTNNVWAVGDGGTILRWNGSVWSAAASGTTDTLNGVWGSSPTDVWAVGHPGLQVSPTGGGTFVHWDGTRWTPVSSSVSMPLYGVWGSGPNDIWAVGDGGTIAHWTNGAWSTVQSGTTELLLQVWGSGPDDVWIVGVAGTILHWDGNAWSAVQSATTSWLSGVWGSAAGDVWAVGDSILGNTVHWNGNAWAPVPLGPLQ